MTESMESIMNICAKNKSVTAYIKKIQAIRSPVDIDIFMTTLNFETVPFFQNTIHKNRYDYYNLPFIALLSGNEQILDKLLTLFPDSLDEYFLIQQQKISQKYAEEKTVISNVKNWDTVQKVLDEKLMDILIQKIAFNTNIHNVLNKHNLLDKILFNCIEYDNTRNQHFSKCITKVLPEYYVDKKIKSECGKYLFRKEIDFHAKNKYKHTEESYKNFKKHYKFFTGNKESEIFSDSHIVVSFFRNPEYVYFNEFFKHHKIQDKNGIEFDEFKRWSAYSNNDAESVIKNHPSLDLLKKIEPFFNDMNHIIKFDEIHKLYRDIFSQTDKLYKDFYLELNNKYSFTLPLEMVNTYNLENLQTVINTHAYANHKVGEKEIDKLILLKLSDEDIQYNSKLFEDILKMENVDPTGVLNSIIKYTLKLDDSDEMNYLITFMERLSSTKIINISFDEIKVNSDQKTQSSSLLENYLLSKTIEKDSILKNTIKNRL